MAVVLCAGGVNSIAQKSFEREEPLADVLDIMSFASEVETQRAFFSRMTPDDFDLVQPMSPHLLPFDAIDLDETFLDGLIGVAEGSTVIYPIWIEPEGDVFNAADEWIGSLPTATRISNVVLQAHLIEKSDVGDYFVAREQETLLFSHPMMMSSGAPDTSFRITSLRATANGVEIGVTNAGLSSEVEFFASPVAHIAVISVTTNLLDEFGVPLPGGTSTNGAEVTVISTNTVWQPTGPNWSGVSSEWIFLGRSAVGTNGTAMWLDGEREESDRMAFYCSALHYDSDLDGLSDAVEELVTRTDPLNPDSDGDGWNDGEEIAYGTDPWDRLSAPKVARNILIHAVCYNPSVGFASSNQWVQIHSSARYPVNLSGFRLEVAGTEYQARFTFPEGTWIRPGRFLLIGGINVPERDYTADWQLPQSYNSVPTSGVRLMPPEGHTPADVMMYGTHSPFNEQGLPTMGWRSTSTTLWANSGYTLSRQWLGMDNDLRTDWTFRQVTEAPYNGSTYLDSDRDGIWDGDEYSGFDNTRNPTDPQNPDTDGDGLEDGFELEQGLDPNNSDTNNTGISDGGKINPDTGRTYAEDQLGMGMDVTITASRSNWSMGASIGSNGWVRFELDNLDGIGIWATVREGGQAPEDFTYTVTNATQAYVENSAVDGFRTLNLLLIPTSPDIPPILTIRDGGTYWENQSFDSLGPDITARFEAVNMEFDNGESYIPAGSFIYIDQRPEMPDVFAYLTPMGKVRGTVDWKCEIEYNRKQRGDIDRYPSSGWRNLVASEPWYLTSEMTADIRGGTATVSCRLAGKEFSKPLYIRGRNPYESDVLSLLTAAGAPWYALPIAKHECGYSSGIFRQFNTSGTLGPDDEDYLACPNWGIGSGRPDDQGGWGIMQLNTPKPVAQELWDWEANIGDGIRRLNSSVIRGEAVDWIARQEAQQRAEEPGKPLENEVFIFNGVAFQKGTARTPEDACTIQAYNGAGNWVIYWQNKTSTTAGSWKINPDKRSYVDSVCGRIN